MRYTIPDTVHLCVLLLADFADRAFDDGHLRDGLRFHNASVRCRRAELNLADAGWSSALR